MKKISAIAALTLTLTCAATLAAEQPESSPALFHIDHPGLKKLSWQLLCQSSTFRELSVTEMIDVLHTNGFHHIELSTGQSLLAERDKDIKVSPEMGAASIEILNAKLKDVHLDIVSYGVADFGQNEADARKVFEFAKALKAKNIVATPARNSLEMLDKLAIEYQINVAILNQPASPYANGNAILQAVQERSTRIGVCADIAAWYRTGHDPMDCIRKLKGRIFEVHLQDSASPKEAAAVADVLKELAEQKFKGAFCVQTATETGPEALKNLAVVVNSFSDTVTKLAATAP